MQAIPALEELVCGLVAALEAQIHPETGLFDPLDGKPSPSGHYGHTCAALALACAGETHWRTGQLALQAWLSFAPDRLGHLPFNRLALLLLHEVLGTDARGTASAALIEMGLGRCTLRRRYPSNNWSLLAQTCRLIEAPAHAKAGESQRLCKLLERWTTPKGCFIDFPERPHKHFSTPIAYHHKALFLVALARWFHDDAELSRHARRMCDWLVHCWDAAGYAGGFGRSTHSLFGDACLIAGMLLLRVDDADPQPISALSQRIARQRRSDGLLWLNPAGHESGKASWDSYMHLSVYNAWAGAVISAALHLRASRDRAPTPCSWLADASGWFHDDAAGLGCIRTDAGLTALISTRGQAPQSYSSNEADFRYAGGVVFHLHHSASGLSIGPPVRVSRTELETRPAAAGWSPLFSLDGGHFGLTEFDRVAATVDPQRIRITLEGRPVSVFRPAPSSAWQRLKSAIDWRYLGGRLGRMAVFQRRKHPGLTARVELDLAIAAVPPTLDVKLEFVHSTPTATRYLNPRGRIWVSAAASGKSTAGASLLPSSLPGAQSDCGPASQLAPACTQWVSSSINPPPSTRDLADSNDAN